MLQRIPLTICSDTVLLFEPRMINILLYESYIDFYNFQ